MKKLFVSLMLMGSLVGFSQNPAEKELVFGEDSIDYDLLNTLVEIQINRFRKENGLDTLTSDKSLREAAHRNSYRCYKMEGTQIKHTDKNVYEVALYGTTNYKASLNQLARISFLIWKMSPPHREILLSKNVKHFGAGNVIGFKMIWENIGSFKNPDQMGWVKNYYQWVSVRFN